VELTTRFRLTAVMSSVWAHGQKIASAAALLVFFITLPVFAQESERIPLETLLKSKAAQLFQSGEYSQALTEFEKLSQEYPNDTLPRRYAAMTLIFLGRLDESIAVFQEAIKMESDNPALHYFLARAYHEQGAKDKAKAELNEVIRLDPEGFYGGPAKAALLAVEERARPTSRKPWIVFGTAGYEYDSNVILTPNNSALRGAGDESAGRYSVEVGGTYKWYERGGFTSRVGYRLYKSLHDDNLNDFNFTYHEFSLDNQYETQHFGKNILYRLRYKIPFGFLGGELFSFSPNDLLASIMARLTTNNRIEVYHQYSHVEFGPDSTIPSRTSRDGEYNQTGVLHRYYFSNFNRWVFAGYYVAPVAARGQNFDSLKHAVQAGLHTPVPFVNKIVPAVNTPLLDIWGQFSVARYDDFVSLFLPEPLKRLDHEWFLVVTLTYPVNPNWSVIASYRYINSNNRNDLYQYDRHVTGLETRFIY